MLQIHSGNSTDDIGLGYGTSAGFTEVMRVQGSGRVGIGTTAPLSRFDVLNGSVTIRGANAGLVFEDSSRVISSEPAAGLGAGIRVSTNVYIVGFSSAARYYGDGSGLTNVAAGNLKQVPVSRDVDYTLTSTDTVVFVDASPNPVTVTLPPASASTVGKVYYIYQVTDSGLNNVSLAPSGGNNINGVADNVISMATGTTDQWRSLRVIGYDAAGWIVNLSN